MSTILYVRTTGNDNNSGTIGSPFRTAQKAFETAYFSAGDYILDFGSGSFGGVNLQSIIEPNLIEKFTCWNEYVGGNNILLIKVNSNRYNGYCGESFVRGVSNWVYTNDYVTLTSSDNPDYPWLATFPGSVNFDNIYPLTPIKTVPTSWPSRISIRGVSPNNTLLGNIIGTGRDNQDYYQCGSYNITSGSNASNISLSSFNINVGNINANGAAYFEDLGGFNGTNGGIVSLTGCYFNNINITGGGQALGGSTFLLNCSGLDILANSYSQYVGYSNVVITATAGSVTIQNTKVRNINSNGANNTIGDLYNGINGGNVTLTQNSSATNIYTFGSEGMQTGGNGGNITLNSSTVNNVYLYGGLASAGCGLGYITGGTHGTLTNINSIISGTTSSFDGGPIYGCTNTDGCNYNPSATCDDSSCNYPDYCYDCSGNCTCGFDCLNACNGNAYSGCTDSSACNFTVGASCDDGSCIWECNNPTARNYHNDGCNPCWYVDCNDPYACNYDINSFGTSECSYTCNDSSARNYHDQCNNNCWYVDCNDSSACNYDVNSFGTSECTYGGCNNNSACNYDSGASCDDGSCTWNCNDSEARNYHAGCDYCWYVDCNDSSACNYDPNAFGSTECTWNCEDSSARNYHDVCSNYCWYVDCNDPYACNYDINSFGTSECIYSSTDYFGNTCCPSAIGGDFFGNNLCDGYTGTCTDTSNACGEDTIGCLYYACNGNCISRTQTLYPNCYQPSVNPTLLQAYKLGILPIPKNNPAIRNSLIAEINNFPLIIQAVTVSYQDGLYGKRYVGYYPDNGGVNAFGTLLRSSGTNSVHGDEEATVDFYNFTSSDRQDYDDYSWQWLGYFKAPYTDDFVFRIANVDDAVDLWIGNNAVSGFTSQNRTTGGLYMADNPSDPIPMVGGQYYPVRLQFSESGGADQFILEYSSSIESNISNFQGKFYHKTQQDFIAANPS